MTQLRLGTRKSALAQAQARWVADRLRVLSPDLVVELVPIVTSGDSPDPGVKQDSIKPPVHGLQTKATTPPGGLKALFTKELEEALLDNRIDLAVHSLKDMAAEIPKGLILAAVPAREDSRDVWISKRRIPFQELRRGAVIATGAVRRQAQLRHLRPDVELVALRGNVDTRLCKLEEEDYDGMVLALAGLKRLGREQAVTDILSIEQMLPAVGQGALAIETREGDVAVLKIVRTLDDSASHAAARAERAFLTALGGTCQTPIAGLAEVSENRLTLTGLVVALSGDPYLRAAEAGLARDPETIGQSLARTLISRGADKILG